MNNSLRLKLSSSLLILSSLFLNACNDKSDYDFTKDNSDDTTETAALPNGPIFDPSNSIIPTTNDLLFAGSTDGTLNIPNDANNDDVPDNPIVAQVNQLDGFSTTNPITIGFGVDVDPSSLGNGVRVYQVTKNPSTGLIVSVIRELTSDEIVAVQTADKQLAIIPKIPLTESSSYLVVLTKDITDTNGDSVDTPAQYFLAKGGVSLAGGNYEALEALRPLIHNMEEKAVEFDDQLVKDNIIMSWSFTTQSISAVLNGLAASAEAGAITMVDSQMTSQTIIPTSPGIADISIGTLDIPYYLEAPSQASPLAPLTSYWRTEEGGTLTRYAVTPKVNSTLTIPVIMTTPNALSGKTMPSTGWPIIIYQHGITRMRSDILAYADSMAQAGFAVIAIDLPLHGVPETLESGGLNPIHTSNTAFLTDVEQSFDVDYVNNTTGALGPDGTADSSGKHFMNLQSLLTSRDNIRQGVSNLLVLRRSLENIANIDADKVGFIAHSLGGIVGIPYLAVESQILPTSLLTTGVGIRSILLESDPFGTDVKNGLAAAGISGADYDAFMYGAQFILESADPINYAIDAGQTHPIHIVEVIGDKVVINSTTETMVALMQAKTVSATDATIAAGSPGIVRFTEGNHRSPLDPTSSIFNELHTQIGAFQATGGSTILVTDDSAIQK